VLVAVSTEGLARIKADRRQRDAWLTQRMRDLPVEDLEALRRAAAVLGRLADS
jgi:hypothetical protein